MLCTRPYLHSLSVEVFKGASYVWRNSNTHLTLNTLLNFCLTGVHTQTYALRVRVVLRLSVCLYFCRL